MADYYSDRTAGPRRRTETEFDERSWGAVTAYVQRGIELGIFAEDFPEQCQDGRGVYTTNAHTLGLAILGEHPDIEWPLSTRSVPSAPAALDLIEFLYRHASEPIKIPGGYHEYQGHHHRREQAGQLTLDDEVASVDPALQERALRLEQVADASPEELRAKEEYHRQLIESPPYERARLLADAWCAAFVQRKMTGATPITHATLRLVADGPERLAPDTRAAIEALREEYEFFHWHVEFPQVFRVPTPQEEPENEAGWSGGFDCVLGNPPWERVKFDEREFLAEQYPAIAAITSANRRRRLVNELAESDPVFLASYRRNERRSFAESHFLRNSQIFPLTGRGRDINTSAVFAERAMNVLSTRGRLGIIVPSGIATDENTSLFFAHITRDGLLVSLFDFENRLRVFPAVDSRVKFCLLTLQGTRSYEPPKFVFFAFDVADLKTDERAFTLGSDDFALLNPATRTCPVFRSRRDADLVLTIYRRAPVLLNEVTGASPWRVRTRPGLFSMGNDAELFVDQSELSQHDETALVPLLEGKLAHIFDHRWATYDGEHIRDVEETEKRSPHFEVKPRYFVPASELDRRLGVGRRWLVGWRKIARATDERTLIPLLLPRAGAGDGGIVLVESTVDPELEILLPTLLGNFVLDYVCRNKVGGSTLQTYVGKQLPVLPPAELEKARVPSPPAADPGEARP